MSEQEIRNVPATALMLAGEEIARLEAELKEARENCRHNLNEWNRAREQVQVLAAVEKSARIIFGVAVYPVTICPHGNGPFYPTHAWWCDDCWGALKAALATVKEETT